MTTIIAVENSDHVLIGSDSQMTAGDQKSTLPYGKIITNGEYTIGAAGEFRFLQFLEHMELPETTSDSLDRFMSQVFAPSLIEQTEKRWSGASKNSVALVVAKRQVYEVTGFGEVVRNARGHYSIGSGSVYALGSLAHIESDVSKKDVIRALETAASYDIGTGGPFWVRKV